MKYIVQNNNSKYSSVIDNIINNSKGKIFSFFNSEEIDLPVTVYVYNSIEDLFIGMRKRNRKLNT